MIYGLRKALLFSGQMYAICDKLDINYAAIYFNEVMYQNIV